MKIIIVGSMKFYDKHKEIKEKLEADGHKIIIPLLNEAYPNENNVKRKTMEDFNDNLEESDAILVANFDKENKKNYIGINSLMEIGMTFNRNKKIFILNDIPDNCKEELEAIGVIALKGNLNNLK